MYVYTYIYIKINKNSYVVHKIVLLYHHFTCIYTYLINIKITIKYFKSIHIITKFVLCVSHKCSNCVFG